MAFINFNGKILADDIAIVAADSRGLKFGDGLFETMRYSSGGIVNWQKHSQRFFSGLQKLNFKPGKHFTPELLAEKIQSLVKKNDHAEARVRLTVFRSHGGLLDPSDLHPNWLIQSWPLPAGYGAFNENGMQLCIYRDAKKHCDFLSNIKHNNYLLPVMASFFAKEQKCNDAIILNHHNRVCETTNANIFVLKDESISTPPLSEGCVAGTMRSLLLELLPQAGFETTEQEITIDNLLNADEIFISNALRPIRWIVSCEQAVLQNRHTQKIITALKTSRPALFD